MELSTLQIGMVTAAALVGGGGVGWWLRGRYNWTQRVIMDELWTRKIKSFEAATTAAQEAQTLSATAEGRAREAMERAVQHASQLEQSLEQYARDEEHLRGELEARRAELASAAEVRANLEGELTAEREARRSQAERLAKFERRVKNLAPYPSRLEERENDLARLEVRMAEFAEEKNAEITRLTDWIAELTPLTETLRRRGEEFSVMQESRRDEERAARERERDLRAELAKREAALEELQQGHQALRDEHERALATQRQDSTSRQALEQGLSQLEDERAQLEVSLEEQTEELARARQESIQRHQKITELQVDLRAARQELEREATDRERLKAQGDALQGAREQLEANQAAEAERSAGETKRKLELEQQTKDLRASLGTRSKELEQLQRKVTSVEAARDRKDQQLEERKQVVKDLRERLAASEKELKQTQREVQAAKTSAGTKKPTPTPASSEKPAATPKHSPKAKRAAKPGQDDGAELFARGSAVKKPARVASDTQPAGKKVAKARKPAAKASKTPKRVTRKDDLTQIKGIGEKVAQKLTKAGVSTYTALSKLQGPALEQLAEEIAVPVKRIKREGWVASARKLS